MFSNSNVGSLLFLVFTIVLFFSACKEKTNGSASDHSNEMGKNVFNNNCASCHGPKGLGDGPAAVGFNPRNFTKDKFKKGDDLPSIIKTLNTGIPGTQMVPFKGILSEKQLEAVAKYVQYLVNRKE